jgi:hypothetical protein
MHIWIDIFGQWLGGGNQLTVGNTGDRGAVVIAYVACTSRCACSSDTGGQDVTSFDSESFGAHQIHNITMYRPSYQMECWPGDASSYLAVQHGSNGFLRSDLSLQKVSPVEEILESHVLTDAHS